jgi:imidazolonepropionase-like amidohydrolase
MHSPLWLPWRGTLVIVIALAAIATPAPTQAQSAQAVIHPTTFYLHGRIYTNDPKHPWAEAMAVRDEKILCIGTISQILLDCGGAESNDVTQLKGNFVMPGFNDAHAHLGSAGRDKLTLALNDATSVDDVTSHAGRTRNIPRVSNSTRQRRSIPFISTTFPATSPSPIL